MKAEPFIASVVYCEDVRQEVGGQQTYVGVTRSEVRVPDFPGQMNRFSVVIDVWQDLHLPVHPVDFEVFLRSDGVDHTYLSGTLDFAEQGKPAEDARYRSMIAVANFAPLAINSPGTLFVRFRRNGEEYVPPGLRFRKDGGTQEGPPAVQ